jgi:hypothetical protein
MKCNLWWHHGCIGIAVVEGDFMLIPSLPASMFTGAASQLLGGLTGHGASGAKGAGADLDSGSIAGAQSFLSTLQQKLAPAGQGNALSAQISQLSSDLKSGNLSGAQTDYTALKQSLNQAVNTQGANSGSDASGSALNMLEQSAYSAALNLSLPASAPTLSMNF